MRDDHSARPDRLSNAILNVIGNNVDPDNKALIRQLADTTLSPQLITVCVELSWNRGQNAHIVLHNALLLMDRLQNDIRSMRPVVFIGAVIGLARHNPNRRGLAQKITTVEELEGAAAVIRFIEAVWVGNHDMLTNPPMSGYTNGVQASSGEVIRSRYLDKLLRTQPERVDRIIAHLTVNPLKGGNKEHMEPLLAFLNDDLHAAVGQGWL